MTKQKEQTQSLSAEERRLAHERARIYLEEAKKSLHEAQIAAAELRGMRRALSR